MKQSHTVTLDPPWLERGGGKIKRGADRHYPLMKTPDIARVVQEAPPFQRVADDAHMYLWVTNNFLPDGLWLMKELGFRYVTNIAWVKCKKGWPRETILTINHGQFEFSPFTWFGALSHSLQIGLGQYFRGSHELCLFGVRGKCMKPPKALPSVIHAPRRKHSQKPEKFFDLVERTSPGPRLEMFAREKRKGWTVWGNEV